MSLRQLFPGVYLIDNKLATQNLAKGSKVYGEDLVTVFGNEYRLWTPYRSKLAAAIMNGLKTFGIGQGSAVLYLGAATGTTSSHVSDIVGNTGKVYGVELSERNMREFINVSQRANWTYARTPATSSGSAMSSIRTYRQGIRLTY